MANLGWSVSAYVDRNYRRTETNPHETRAAIFAAEIIEEGHYYFENHRHMMAVTKNGDRDEYWNFYMKTVNIQ